MKICWYFDQTQTRLFYRLAMALKECYGVSEHSGYVVGVKWYRYLVERGFRPERLVLISDAWEQRLDRPPDLDYLREMEATYGVPNLGLMIDTDRTLRHLPYNEALGAAEQYFRQVIDFFDRVKPDVVVMGDLASLPPYIMQRIARARGIEFLSIVYGRQAHRVAVVSNTEGRWEAFEAAYRDLAHRAMTAEERSEAEAYLEKFIHSPPDVSVVHRPELYRFRFSVDWRRLGRYLKEHYFIGRRRDFYEPSLLDYIAIRFRRFWRFCSIRLERTFEAPLPGEPYVYYPLHYQPEASTLVRGPYFVNQPYVVEAIAKSLPAGIRLYVKEHIRGVGGRKLGDYRAIRQNPAVRLIDPMVDAREILEGAQAVVTVTGTAGWEALLLGKPVLVLGNVFYQEVEGVTKVGDLRELPKLIQEALARPLLPKDQRLRLVATYLRATHPGEIFAPKGEPFLDQVNVERLTSLLARELALAEPVSGSRAREG
ncbi:MAG: hypothetical protein RX318_00520 [bacterium]|nr:hypothetical protein [bacterium]